MGLCDALPPQWLADNAIWHAARQNFLNLFLAHPQSPFVNRLSRTPNIVAIRSAPAFSLARIVPQFLDTRSRFMSLPRRLPSIPDANSDAGELLVITTEKALKSLHFQHSKYSVDQ
jgi:hypothetical protein